MMEPYPFQTVAIDMGRETNLLLADECGLGKTLMGTEIIKALYASEGGQDLPSLIVCPKPVRMQWLGCLAEQCPDLERDVLYVSEPFDPKEYRRRRMAVVSHYEAIVRHKDVMSKVLWNIIICDEAHRIGSRQADRTDAVKKLPTLRKVALTGTPVERSPADMWSILNWLNPNDYPGYWAFFEKYVKTVPSYNGHFKVVPGCLDPKGLEKELAPFTLRRTRQDVAPWLPPVIASEIPVMMSGKQADLYKTIDDATDALIDIGEGEVIFVRNALSKILKLQQVTSNPRLLGYSYYEAASAKEDWLADWIRDHPDEPVVIFCQFRETVKWLAKKLKADRILGGTDPHRPANLSRCNRIVATIAAAGEGIDLPHIRTAIFYDVIWPARRMTQAVDRIQRLSNTEPKQAIYLIIPDTVDELVYNAVKYKWDFHKLINALMERRHAKRAA